MLEILILSQSLVRREAIYAQLNWAYDWVNPEWIRGV